MIPEPGRRFGPYEIQARLGAGGMGHVFRAWDERLRREVAIKLLHDEFAVPEMRERFLREARAASSLNHPNICTIFDFGEQDGDPYIVMELLQGETLKTRILQGPIPVEDIVSISRDVAEALGAAHAKGMVHRDVKPANIFLIHKPNGRVQAKVLDFGLAKMDSGAVGVRGRRLDLTVAGSTVGTLAYMSPEQARGEVLDLRSDLFSLGVVMYEMATLQIPFPGATSALIFVKLLNQPPEPVREWNQQISRPLEKIILKLMAKERTSRFQTASELEQALLELSNKPAAGWLRKAIGTAPLTKAIEPPGGQRRVQVRSGSEPDTALPQGPGPVGSPSETQLLRPVSRLPQRSTDQDQRADGARSRPEAAPSESGVERGQSVSQRPPRERYHPDPDQLFELPGLRAEQQNGEVERAVFTAGESAFGRPMRLTPDAASGSEASRIVRSTMSEGIPSEFGPGLSEDDFQASEEGLFDGLETQAPPYRGFSKRRSRYWVLGGIALTLSALAILAFQHRGHFTPTYLNHRDLLVVSVIENRTGNEVLDGGVAEGLQLDLEESPSLRMAGRAAYFTAAHSGADEEITASVRARAAAQRVGAKAYLFGSVSNTSINDDRLKGTSPAYSLHVDLLRVSNNEILASLDESATSLQQIPGAIDRLADDIRMSAGEEPNSDGRTYNPLTVEATGNLEALSAFSLAESALAEGHTLEALGLYRKALTSDPKFTQANLRLAVLYRKQRAEVAALDAAKGALASASGSSERVRMFAQYEYEINATGDFGRATEIIRGWLERRPHDSEALADLARVERLQGRLSDALQHAQLGIAEDPFNLDAYIQGSNALIGLDRYDAALTMEQQAQRQGLPHVGGSLIGGYLGEREDILTKAVEEYTSNRPVYRSDWAYGLYLDNTGRLAEGLALWRANAAAAERLDGLQSASAYLLAQAALDRALVGDCDHALPLAAESDGLPQGMMTLSNSGMAEALCGAREKAGQHIDELQHSYPKGTDAQEYFIPDIKAAVALQANNPSAALEELRPVRRYDLISLTPFLRGRAHVALGQLEVGIVDFQTVLSHRGITFTVGTDVYPVAELGVARAFAQTGDISNSTAAYRQFLKLWANGDRREPLLLEARLKTSGAGRL